MIVTSNYFIHFYDIAFIYKIKLFPYSKAHNTLTAYCYHYGKNKNLVSFYIKQMSYFFLFHFFLTVLLERRLLKRPTFNLSNCNKTFLIKYFLSTTAQLSVVNNTDKLLQKLILLLIRFIRIRARARFLPLTSIMRNEYFPLCETNEWNNLYILTNVEYTFIRDCKFIFSIYVVINWLLNVSCSINFKGERFVNFLRSLSGSSRMGFRVTPFR